MQLKELARSLRLEPLTPEVDAAGREVVRGYVSDLLSDVLAHGPRDGVLVTIQAHLNVVAVASHAGLAAVIFALGRAPEESVRRKAAEEGIALYVSPDDAFEIVGRMYALGIRGTSA